MTNNTVSGLDIPGLHLFVCELLQETRARIQQKISSGYFHSLKDDYSSITEVDRDIEYFLQEKIGEKFPDHNFVGEEHPPRSGTSPFTWYVDPIDGTQNFTHDIPTFGTIIALHQENQPIVAAIDHPNLNETFSAALGAGSFRNAERLKIKDIESDDQPRHQLITVSSPSSFHRTGEVGLLERLVQRHQNLRIYGDCFAQTCTFSGRAGASVQFNVKAWDIAAAQLLTQEAGGKVVSLRKNETAPGGPYFGMIIGKPRVVDYLQTIFEDCNPETLLS